MRNKTKKPRLIDELMEAVDNINQWREGKITLKSYTAAQTPNPEVTP